MLAVIRTTKEAQNPKHLQGGCQADTVWLVQIPSPLPNYYTTVGYRPIVVFFCPPIFGFLTELPGCGLFEIASVQPKLFSTILSTLNIPVYAAN